MSTTITLYKVVTSVDAPAAWMLKESVMETKTSYCPKDSLVFGRGKCLDRYEALSRGFGRTPEEAKQLKIKQLEEDIQRAQGALKRLMNDVVVVRALKEDARNAKEIHE